MRLYPLLCPSAENKGLTASLCFAITLQVIYALRVLVQDELDLRLTGVLNIIEKRSSGAWDAVQ